VLALVVGLFICCARKRSKLGVLLLVALAGFVFALLLTVTRASWMAALASTFLILLCNSSRRGIAIGGAVAMALVLVGVFVLRQQRSINPFDRSDQSTTWREQVWREGYHLLVSSPRHLLVGVGMDSIKGHRREWRLFDNGRLPSGHMHSNLLQIALERGIPTLVCWLVMLGLYARMLWRMARSGSYDHWIERGLILGALGGLCGFFLSGLVHYNWGDSEVVTIFYIIMGLNLSLRSKVQSPMSSTQSMQ
jgi:O-antigen ligase